MIPLQTPPWATASTRHGIVSGPIHIMDCWTDTSCLVWANAAKVHSQSHPASPPPPFPKSQDGCSNPPSKAYSREEYPSFVLRKYFVLAQSKTSPKETMTVHIPKVKRELKHWYSKVSLVSLLVS